MKKVLIFILCILICPVLVSAIGIGPPRQTIEFQAGLEKELIFFVVNTEQLDLSVSMYSKGELAEFITIENNQFNLKPGEKKDVAVKLKLPFKIDTPGKNLIKIGALASPKSSKDATVAAKAGVESQLYIDVPYEGKYLTASLNANNAKVGENINFAINLKNNGLENIDSVSGIIKIYDSESDKVSSVNVVSKSVNAGESEKLEASWNTKNVKPGSYKAIADIDFDGNKKSIEASFNVGDVLIEIIDLKNNDFKPGDIAKFTITVQSKWNKKIYNAFSLIEVYDMQGNLQGETESKKIDIGAWERKDIEAFWDSTGAVSGDYKVKVVLNYEGKTSEKNFNITVKEKSSYGLIILSIIVVMLMIVVAWFKWEKSRKKKR
ncbi:MAG: CARDB domain-containing protein [Nanoarchaeota archaeon]|nr:CARDB domain-containing protein [Nanoarchaeota archaeon]